MGFWGQVFLWKFHGFKQLPPIKRDLYLYSDRVLSEMSSKNHKKEDSSVGVNTGLSALLLINIHPAL